jgi:hypothetical protein
MSLAYADITGTSGNLTLLYFGNKVYPNNSLYASSSYIRATVPTGSYPKQYPVTLVMSQALGTASATISIPQGQNFVWTGVAINDSAYPVAINFHYAANVWATAIFKQYHFKNDKRNVGFKCSGKRNNIIGSKTFYVPVIS